LEILRKLQFILSLLCLKPWDQVPQVAQRGSGNLDQELCTYFHNEGTGLKTSQSQILWINLINIPLTATLNLNRSQAPHWLDSLSFFCRFFPSSTEV
jgi:hypothetical protein